MFSPKCATKSMIQYTDRRKGKRLPPCEDIEIVVCDQVRRQLRAAVKDIRNHGFRIVYEGATLASGTEFQFENGSSQGRARLIWSRCADGRNEGSCVVLAG